MRTLTAVVRRAETGLIVGTVSVSVLVGYLVAARRLDALGALACMALFIILFRDLRIVVPILLVVGPLGGRIAMSFGNLYLSTAIVIVACVAWLLRNPLFARPFTIRRNRITDALAVLLAVIVLSSLQNLSLLVSTRTDLLRFIQSLLHMSFFFIVLDMSFTRTQIRRLLALVLVVGALEGLIGVWQWRTTPGFYVTGTFEGAHNNYAVYIVYVTFLFLGVLLESRCRVTSVLSLISLAAVLYSIVFSFSRTGYVALAAGIVTVFAVPHRRARKLWLAGALTGAVVVISILTPASVVSRAGSILASLGGERVAISFGARLDLWKASLSEFARYPILGVGAGVVGLRDSFYIKILNMAGIAGATAFAWLLYVMMSAGRRLASLRFKDDLVRGIAMGQLPAMMACLIVFNITADYFEHYRFMGTLWIVLALTLNYAGSGDSRMSEVQR
jgi:O-antigen ligase